MADLNLQRVDFSSIKAIAHNGVTLNVLIERNGGYCLESLPAPLQAFQGLLQLAQFTTLLQQFFQRLDRSYTAFSSNSDDWG